MRGASNLGKKEGFQSVPKNTNGEFRIVRERVPNGKRSVEEATKADCLSSRSRDYEKTLLKPGWTQGGASGRYWHRDAVVGEVPGRQPVEAFEDEKTDLEPHLIVNVKPM